MKMIMESEFKSQRLVKMNVSTSELELCPQWWSLWHVLPLWRPLAFVPKWPFFERTISCSFAFLCSFTACSCYLKAAQY
jgi:hypothetical protein